MTNQRISVTTFRQLMQFESSELTMRDIGRALQLSAGAVSKYRCAVRIAGLTWNEAQHLADTELERRVWQARAERQPRSVVLPDCALVHTELKRHKHVTLQLVWDEYHARHGALALRYSAFCERYRQWLKRLRRSMRRGRARNVARPDAALRPAHQYGRANRPEPPFAGSAYAPSPDRP